MHGFNGRQSDFADLRFCTNDKNTYKNRAKTAKTAQKKARMKIKRYK